MRGDDDDRSLSARVGDAVAARLRAPASVAPAPVAGGDGGPGDPLRGAAMLEGRWSFGDVAARGAPGAPPWEAPGAPRAAHGFGWLGDVAAAAPDAARDWTAAWLARFGAGRGPGWTAALAGRRAGAWLDHPDGAPQGAALAIALSRHAAFLRRRRGAAPAGRPRLEAGVGLLRAALALGAADPPGGPLAEALAGDARSALEAAETARDPGAIADAVVLMAAALGALEGAGRPVPGALRAAGARGAALLRGLRHADGTLPRLQGGGPGDPARMDAALAALRAPARAAEPPVAGYARLASGRTTVILDGAAPPAGRAGTAHASTLAMEVTSGRRPLVVSCGPGAAFGADWRRAGRSTGSHSVLSLDGLSAARLEPRRDGGVEALVAGPGEVRCGVLPGPAGRAGALQASHDAWRGSHGLTYGREVRMLPEGRGVEGEDTLAALDAADRARLAAAGPRGLPFDIRFHLHPQVDVARAPEGARLAARSGEMWDLAHDGACELRIEASVYLDARASAPLAARQVVLSGRASGPVTRVRWRIEKAEGTPDWLRDLEPAGGWV